MFQHCRMEHTDLQSHWLATLFWEISCFESISQWQRSLPIFGDNTQKLHLQSVYSQPYSGARLNFVHEVKVGGGDGAKFWRHKAQPRGTAWGVQEYSAFPLWKGCLPARASLHPLLWDRLSE